MLHLQPPPPSNVRCFYSPTTPILQYSLFFLLTSFFDRFYRMLPLHMWPPERVHDRGLKRLANAADAESDDDADEEVEVANGDSVLSSRRAVRQRSHGSSSSSSSPAAARIATASAGTPQRSRRPSAVATTKNSSKSHLQSKLSAEFAAKPAHVLLDPVPCFIVKPPLFFFQF